MGDSINLFLARLMARTDKPLVIAHRGDSFHAPENTIVAAQFALDAGADAWELDVQLTRDGVPVVLHDQSLVRTTDVAMRLKNDPRAVSGFHIADFDYEEVKTLDAGSWFVDTGRDERSAVSFGTVGRLTASSIAHYRSGRVTIPTLADALSFTRNHDWLVNVEIKSFPGHPAGLVERVLEVIAETGTSRRVLISSFDHTDVARANRPGREYALGLLASTPLHRTPDYVALLGADTVHLSAEVLGSESIAYRRCPAARSLRTDLISELKDRRVPLLVYTVNDHGAESLSQHLAVLGVDGLFTDDPTGLGCAFRRQWPIRQGGPR